MNIVVLCGGLSSERDVSFKSGEMVAKALKSNGHKVFLMDVFMGYKDAETDVSNFFDNMPQVDDIMTGITADAPDIDAVKAMRADKSECFFGPNVLAICRQSDMVFLALHGSEGENGKIQAAFDLMGIRYTGNGSLPCAIAMDKGLTKKFMKDSQVPFPKGVTVKKTDRVEELINELKFPLVVKPSCGGSSIGVSIVFNGDELQKALDDAFKWEDETVVEEYVKGREFSVGVVEGKALPVIEIAPKVGFYDYKNKYAAGSAVETCPAEINAEDTAVMQQYATKVCEVIGLTAYARMDFIMTEDHRIFCLEANTLPGMTPTSLLPQEAAAVGMDFEHLCDHIIDVSMRKYI